MKLLILGASGFIGKSITNYFHDHGEFKLLLPSASELDLLNLSDCQSFFKRNKPDCVVHCVVNYASITETITAYYNVVLCKSSYDRLVYFGSGAEYNPFRYKPLMVEEFAKQSFSDRNNPVIGQDFSKFNFSDGNYPLGKWLIGNHIENNILDKTINLRLFGLFGEYEDFTRRFISNNVCRILSGLPISINKDMKFDYLYIKDFCAYLKKILYKKTWSSRTYNFCSGKPIRLTELAQIIKNLMGVEEMFTVNLQGENREYSGDPSKLINEFGALQTTPHERAIFEMIEFYKNQFAVKRNFKEDFIDSLLNARVVFSQQEKNRLKKH